MEDLEKLDASDVYPRRINAKEILIRQTDDDFMFPFADGTAKLSGKDYEFRESSLRQEQPVRSEDFSGELQGEPGESQPTETTDDADSRADFGRSKVTSSIVITRNFGFKRYVPKEKTPPIPPKFIDVTRSTHTDLDVLQEKRIDDYWNVDSGRHLSNSWTGFTKFTLLKEKPPTGCM